MDCMAGCAEYRTNADDQQHYLVKQVNELKQQCSVLKKYEHKMEQIIILEDELEEDEQFYQDTIDNIS